MENLVEGAFQNIYQGKTVLITGHTGFKGAWLSLWLNLLGANVIGYSNGIPTNPSLFKTLNLHEKLNHIIGDVRNLGSLQKILQTFNPEFVFHLAAQALVNESYRLPVDTYETNIMGTVNVLEACRTCSSIRSILIVTSDKCYDNKETEHCFNESDAMGGFDPYSSSKGCAELVVNAYRNSFFNLKDYGSNHNVTISTARAGNVIGGGDWAADRLIPDCFRFLNSNEAIIIRNPESIRPWQYVLEPLSGYLWLAAKQYMEGTNYSGAWNFGPDERGQTSVKLLVEKVVELWGNGNVIINNTNKTYESKILKLNTNKALNYLLWQPVYNLEETLKHTKEWYESYYKMKIDMLNLSVKQLEKYTLQAKNRQIIWAV